MQRIAKSLLQLGQAVGLRVEASGQAAAFARWSSTAATSSAEASSVNPLTKLQSIKKALRPQDSGRNAFRRAWAKQLQIKWNAQAGKASRAAARQRQHEKRLQQFKQRAAWAAETAA